MKRLPTARAVPRPPTALKEAAKLGAAELFIRLRSGPDGLTRREAAARLARFGEYCVAVCLIVLGYLIVTQLAKGSLVRRFGLD